MKFWARVKLNEEDRSDVANLHVAFFEEFHPESSISYDGKEVVMEVIFENPPLKIIEAIGQFKDYEFHYGNPSNAYQTEKTLESSGDLPKEPDEKFECNSEDKKADEKSEADETELLETKTVDNLTSEVVNDEEKTEVPKEAKKKARAPRRTKTRKYVEEIEIPELKEFAEKSESYQEFGEKISKWLNIGERHDFFMNLVLAAKQVEKFAWENLLFVLEEYRIPYSSYDKIWCGMRVNEKFKEINPNVTTLELLKAIAKYSSYEFKKETSEEQEETNSAVKMLEELFTDVDKKKPIAERVKFVLTKIGWKDIECDDLAQRVFRMTNNAVRLSKMEWSDIFKNADIPEEEQYETRMELRSMLNNFLLSRKSFDEELPNVNLFDFFRKVQNEIIPAGILLEDEIAD